VVLPEVISSGMPLTKFVVDRGFRIRRSSSSSRTPALDATRF